MAKCNQLTPLPFKGLMWIIAPDLTVFLLSKVCIVNYTHWTIMGFKYGNAHSTQHLQPSGKSAQTNTGELLQK